MERVGVCGLERELNGMSICLAWEIGVQDPVLHSFPALLEVNPSTEPGVDPECCDQSVTKTRVTTKVYINFSFQLMVKQS